MFMKKLLVFVLSASLLAVPFISFADSTVSASADNGASVSPSGTTVVLTGNTQVFSIGANAGFSVGNVTVDGASQGAVSSVSFTGIALDAVSHSISVSSFSTGGSMPYCSGPTAPGWQAGEVDGGCSRASVTLDSGNYVSYQGIKYDCPIFFTSGCRLPR